MQALFELDMVPGHDVNEKRVYLEDQFALADTNGDGVVDFAEFVAFYTMALHDSRKSDHVQERRAKTKKAREERQARAVKYVNEDSIFAACAAGVLKPLSAKWLLDRAGYAPTTKERRGVSKTTWALSEGATVTPLPPRQVLETESPQAFMTVQVLKDVQGAFLQVRDDAGASESSGVCAVPVVLTSFCWETEEHADPSGAILSKIATNLARQLPAYQAWGYSDIGVYIDWACMFQSTPSGYFKRTVEQEKIYAHCMREIMIWYGHKMTTVYLINDQALDPGPMQRGWHFFINCLMMLFKDTAPTKPWKVTAGQLVPFWSKCIDLASDDIQHDPMGVNPQAGAIKRNAPLSAPHFVEQLRSKSFPDATKAKDSDLLGHLYRAAIEDGFNSLEHLSYGKLGWSDDEVAELASCLHEVSMPHVVDLDLSWNDMRTGSGLDAIGFAISIGALHSLQRLNLINCTAIKTLPEAIGELLELQIILVSPTCHAMLILHVVLITLR